MKKLILLRHAKSDWSLGSPYISDHDRNLAKRGLKSSVLIANYFKSAKIKIEAVRVSSAVRATQTYQIIKSSLSTSPAEVLRELYTFDESVLIDIIRSTKDKIDSLLIIGHNPALQKVVLKLVEPDVSSKMLTRVKFKYPTAAVAILNLNISSWNLTGDGCGNLDRFVTPKELSSI